MTRTFGGWLSAYIAIANGNPAFEALALENEGDSNWVHACVDWRGSIALITPADTFNNEDLD